MAKLREVSHENVRKLAISRQHLAKQERPSFIDLFRDLGCVQLDPIRHVARTHRLVLWSRLGNYDETAFAAFRWDERAVFEYWAHAASMVLTEEFPVHYYHMAMSRDPESSRWAKRREDWFNENGEVLRPLSEHLLAELAKGPKLSREFEGAREEGGRWYNGRLVPRLLDYHWTRGEVMIVGRDGNQRIWGLAEDFWPEWTPREKVWSDVEVTTYSAQKAIRALGIATAKQIKFHYTRHVYPHLPQVLADLVADGTLLQVDVTKDGESLKGRGICMVRMWLCSIRLKRAIGTAVPRCYLPLTISFATVIAQNYSGIFITGLRFMCPKQNGNLATMFCLFCTTIS